MISVLQVLQACDKADRHYRSYFGRSPGLPRLSFPIGPARELMMATGASLEACEGALWDANSAGLLFLYEAGHLHVRITTKGRGWLFMLAAPDDEIQAIMELRQEHKWRSQDLGQGDIAMEVFQCQQ